MQFLASLHIVLTCSFVLILAYLLSIIFSYLASSVIHGSSAPKTRRQRSTHAAPAPPRSTGRPPAVEVVPERPELAVMDRLQEEEEEHDEDAYTDAGSPAPGYEFAESIFSDGASMGEDEIRRDEYSRHAGDGIVQEDLQQRDELRANAGRRRPHHDDDAGEMGNGELHEADDGEGGLYRDAEVKQSENELRWDKKEGGADVKESSNGGSTSKFSDAQGSSSPQQQRLPPTWSDLQRMVNMNSKKDLLGAPAQDE